MVFQEGLLSTFRKAKQIGAHLVSTHWVMACDESFSKIEEARYPIEKLQQYEFADPLQKSIKVSNLAQVYYCQIIILTDINSLFIPLFRDRK